MTDVTQPPDPGAAEEEEEEWFGEGSAFDSGEDLAAALFAMAGVQTADAPADGPGTLVASQAHDDSAYDEWSSRGAATATVPTAPMDLSSFQISERPALVRPGPSTWGVREQGNMSRGPAQWGMRHSVQMLKTTEQVMARLQRDAIEVAFHAAARAYAQRSPRSREIIR